MTNRLLWITFPQNAAKQAAAAATQTIAAAQNAAASNKNTAAHQQLVQSCKVRIKAHCECSQFFFLFLSCTWNAYLKVLGSQYSVRTFQPLISITARGCCMAGKSNTRRLF